MAKCKGLDLMVRSGMFRASWKDTGQPKPRVISIMAEVDPIELWQGIDYAIDKDEDNELFAHLLPGAPISVNSFRIIMARLNGDVQLEIDYLYQEDISYAILNG